MDLMDGEEKRHRRFRCQQGGGDVMIWVGIIGNELIGPYRVHDGVKITFRRQQAICHVLKLKN